MTSYFVKVWKNGKHVETLCFFSADEAWKYCVENKITNYSVYKAECLIDISG